jgi:hypothetical protein
MTPTLMTSSGVVSVHWLELQFDHGPSTSSGGFSGSGASFCPLAGTVPQPSQLLPHPTLPLPLPLPPPRLAAR